MTVIIAQSEGEAQPPGGMEKGIPHLDREKETYRTTSDAKEKAQN